MKIVAPYGTWHSDITGNVVAEQSLRISSPALLNDSILWLEGRPSEKGRQVIVMQTANGEIKDILPSPWSARSKAHEYGGAAFTAVGNNIYFVNGLDQQIYSMDITQQKPIAITNTPNCRYADISLNQSQSHLLAVCEQHCNEPNEEPKNSIICIDLTIGSMQTQELITTIDDSHDFVSNPRFSPCGSWISYLSWDHPNMPWDNTQLWVQVFNDQNPEKQPIKISGNGDESIFQPQWSPSGDLFWVSDKTDWWNIYSLNKIAIENAIQNKPYQSETCIYSDKSEFATPQWVFGMSSYCFLSDDSIFATSTQNGLWQATRLNKKADQWHATTITSDLIQFSALAGANTNKAVFIGASFTTPEALYTYSNNLIAPIKNAVAPAINKEDISCGKIISFPTKGNNQIAYGIFYAPKNSKYQADSDSKPPLIVFGHGGPTGASDPYFRYKIQFWTQRGFAILDVNYRGSTGYGRSYRHSLQKKWGIYDVEDLAAAAEYVSTMGWVHPNQKVVRGSSAGGFTVLAALTDTNTFNAGCSLYGIGDLETLATDTHKFEARYLDGLIGPYPQQKTEYIKRSPIHKVSKISCPVMVFQGGEDKVVPKQQAEAIVAAVKQQGLPVGYSLYPEEGHGFRQAKNIQHQAEAELYFYQQVLGLTSTQDQEPPTHIMNWQHK